MQPSLLTEIAARAVLCRRADEQTALRERGRQRLGRPQGVAELIDAEQLGGGREQTDRVGDLCGPDHAQSERFVVADTPASRRPAGQGILRDRQ